jgi:hypothetical protein
MDLGRQAAFFALSLFCSGLVSKWCPSEAKVDENSGNLVTLSHKAFVSKFNTLIHFS